MNLVDFLSLDSLKEFFLENKLICFRGSQYPSFFFSLFFNKLKSQVELQKINLEDQDINQLKITLDMSFLGNSANYWLKDLTILDSKISKNFYSYLENYRGINTIIFFADETVKIDKNNFFIIELPTKIDEILYKKIFKFFFDSITDDFFTNQIFNEFDNLAIDDACILMRYQSISSRRSGQLFSDLIKKIFSPELSLFTLSQNFFGLESGQFLKNWQKIESNYPIEFWITYWSDQIWQASIFIYNAQKSGIQDAKKMVNRLPFSFMQKDYKRFSLKELSKAHDFLYKLDFNNKNGAGSFGLELWFFKFFQRDFCK
ncbi:hypothetical protein M1446_00075 [Candidatus Dependentiae bacterium]|nr:hypothetical protein [Candidatus Dependentiae bacterium]